MKKTGLLNSEISFEISKMGHTDMLTICDSGLPIHRDLKRIDLALTEGTPGFLETLDTILEELQVEEIIVAKEIKSSSEELYKQIINRFENITITEVDHETFKKITEKSKAIVRTGEFTPYANIILVSGVVF